MAGELPDLLPVATPTSHPDLDIVTGLPTSGSIVVATRSTAASTIRNRILPIFDHAARLLTFIKEACAVVTGPDTPTRFIPNLSNEEVVQHIHVDPHWPTWKKVSIFRHEQAGGAAACVNYLWSHGRSRTLWQLLAKEDTISGSFLFSYVPSEIMSLGALRHMCEAASVDPDARANSWMIAARPFCQVRGVRHVLLRTDDHAVLALFNKDHTVVTFSHIEELDTRTGPTTEDDAPIPPAPNPSLFTMVAQAMVDCRESVASEVVETVSITPEWTADSLSILRFPRTNVADTPPAAQIVGQNFLRSALDFQLRGIEAEIWDEISEADEDMDGEEAIGQEAEEMQIEEAADQVEEVMPAAPQDCTLEAAELSTMYRSDEKRDLPATLPMVATAPVFLDQTALVAMAPESVERLDKPEAMLYQRTHLHPNAGASGSWPAFEPAHPSALPSYPIYDVPGRSDAKDGSSNYGAYHSTPSAYGRTASDQVPSLPQALETTYGIRADGHQSGWNDGNAAYLSYDTQPLVHAASHHRDQIMAESTYSSAAFAPRSSSTLSSLAGWDGGMGRLQSTSGAYTVTANNEASGTTNDAQTPIVVDVDVSSGWHGTSTNRGGYGAFDSYGTGHSANDGLQPFREGLNMSPASAPYSSPLQPLAMGIASHASKMRPDPESYAGLLPGQNMWSMDVEEPMVDMSHPTVMPSFSSFDHEEAQPMDGVFAEMAATTSSVVKENAPHVGGVKRKRAVTEGESESDASPIAPIVAFDLQPRTPGVHRRIHSAPQILLDASSVDRYRPLIPARSRSYHRNHGPVGRAPSLETVDEVDETDDEVQEEERPAKRPRTSDVAPPVSGATKAVAAPVTATATATVAQSPRRARPSQTYEQRQLALSHKIAGKRVSVHPASPSIDKEMKVELVEVELGKELIGSSFGTKARATRASTRSSTDAGVTHRPSRRNAVPSPAPGEAGSSESATSTKVTRAKGKAKGKGGSHPSKK
ncbi:hypothetical protein FRB97_002717 [Tulasnella sp. 331]|nr:hypothetical protein FRB97_002717 [Tulasnella sp. 331]